MAAAALPARSFPLASETGATSLTSMPAEVDASWWRRHAHLVRDRDDQGSLRFQPGAPLEMPGPAVAPPAETAFEGLLGQEDLVARLRRMVEGSRRRGTALPHVLLAGPAGTDKTTLARGLAAAAGRPLVVVAASLVGDRAKLVRLLAGLSEGGLSEGSVLFLEEVNALSRPLLGILLQALSERRLTLVLSDGALTRHVTLTLPPFTLVAATTDESAIPRVLHSRFGLYEALLPHAEEVLAQVVRTAAAARGSQTSRSGALPEGTTRLDGPTGEQAHARLGNDDDDLDPAEQRYHAAPRDSRLPIPFSWLTRSVGTTQQILVKHLEPWPFDRRLVRSTLGGGTAALDGRCSRVGRLASDRGTPNVRQVPAGAFSTS
jgi:hypothetical protein